MENLKDRTDIAIPSDHALDRWEERCPGQDIAEAWAESVALPVATLNREFGQRIELDCEPGEEIAFRLCYRYLVVFVVKRRTNESDWVIATCIKISNRVKNLRNNSGILVDD